MSIVKGGILKSSLFILILSCANSLFSAAPFKYEANYSGWSQLAQSLKTCTPGSFTVPDPIKLGIINQGRIVNEVQVQVNERSNAGVETTVVPDITTKNMDDAIQTANITYQIVGWKQGKCQVIITTAENAPENLGSVTCMFSQEQLPELSSKAIDIGTETKDPNYRDPASLMSAKTCNARKQPPLGPTFSPTDPNSVELPIYGEPVTPIAPTTLPPGPGIPPGDTPYPMNP